MADKAIYVKFNHKTGEKLTDSKNPFIARNPAHTVKLVTQYDNSTWDTNTRLFVKSAPRKVLRVAKLMRLLTDDEILGISRPDIIRLQCMGEVDILADVPELKTITAPRMEVLKNA